MDKETRKKLKRIRREIDRFKGELKKMQLRPFHGDAELRKKEEDLKIMKREIYELEKEANQLTVYISGKG